MTTNDLEIVLKVLAAVGSITSLCAVILCWKSPELMKVFLTFVRDVMRDRRSAPRPPKEKTKPKTKQTLEDPLDSQI